MEGKKESHCWWFDSHTTINSSPWLQSTLEELNEKTKAMLNLVEDDADSFAERAEMYYQRRPQLVSMVEDFYRAHRSLAERYDQLKCDRSLRVRSTLRQLSSVPKDEYENSFDSTNSVKSLDSFTETAYSSEVDDPELEDDYNSNELSRLREELDRLREENEIQKNQIKNNAWEKEELISQIEGNINELAKFRDECEAIKAEILFIQETMVEDGNIIDMSRLWDEIKILKLECVKLREVANEKDRERIELVKKLGVIEEENKIRLKHEEENKAKVARLLEEVRIELMEFGNEIQPNNRYTKNAILKEERCTHAGEGESELEKILVELMKLRREARKCFIKALEEKDEEKRAVIRQLSLAMEIQREDNARLKISKGKETMKLREQIQRKDMALVNDSAEKAR